ncbi:hypothetical protein L3Q82_016332 [Scortum barcoo]|uniref:Uncharacterized protein n=1 Tax=Scortum barcoo TaxID=214431 RepID=A0ACB8VSS7_9TELE|nr:hypothetical protein L3Q82_016332 [Scortum barcoo]
MKCFERLVKSFTTSSIPDSLDPLQFAYRPNRSTEDAASPSSLHTALSPPGPEGHICEMLFSASTHINVPSKLVTKLRDLGLNSALCDWILNFLTGRPQAVRIGQHHILHPDSEHWHPPGLCAQPSAVYSLFTLWPLHSSNIIIRSAVDTTVISLITTTMRRLQRAGQQPPSQHQQQQKELMVDFRRRQREEHAPLSINGTTAEEDQHGLQDPLQQLLQVHHREDPDWLHHRLLWQLLLDCEALQREVKAAQHISRTELPSMEDLYTQQGSRRKATRIITDLSHPEPQTVLSAAIWPTVLQHSS